MKKHFLVLGALVFAQLANAQAWERGGNNNSIPPVSIGTNFNRELLFETGDNIRMRINQSGLTTYDGYTKDVSGFVGINPNGYFNTRQAVAMLHLEGARHPLFDGGNSRAWFNIGVFMRESSDGMYVGLKRNAENKADAVVSWSDDGGEDFLRFIFTGTQGLYNSAGNNPLNSKSQDGYEIMRMGNTGPANSTGTGAGYVGIGPLFTNGQNPQSRLHIHGEETMPTYLQITHANGGLGNGTGQTVDDGLRIGTEASQLRSIGYLKWQENTPFIVQSGVNTLLGGPNERMRISSVASPNISPSTFGNNATRVSIPLVGNIPITNPRATLHLGANAGLISYADWMENGLLVSSSGTGFIGTNSSSIFTGLTDSDFPVAGVPVIGYGNNHLLFANTQRGEVMRIQNLTDNLGIGNFGSNGLNQEPSEKLDVNGNARFRDVPAQGGQSIIFGLEAGSIDNDIELSRNPLPNDPNVFLNGNGQWSPAIGAQGVPGKDGKDGAPGRDGKNGLDGLNGAKGEKGDKGDPAAFANNGLSYSPTVPNTIVLGQDPGQAGNPGKLLVNREIPMNNHNIFFTDGIQPNNNFINSVNNVRIGSNSGVGKLSVTSKNYNYTDEQTCYTIEGINSANALNAQALYLKVEGPNRNAGCGALIDVSNSTNSNIGIQTRVRVGSTFREVKTKNYGAIFETYDAQNENYGVLTSATNNNQKGIGRNTGINASASFGKMNYGGYFIAISNPNSSINTGVYATVAVSPNNVVSKAIHGFSPVANSWAGYFDGKVNITGSLLLPSGEVKGGSDSIFKKEVRDINGTLGKLMQLKPREYIYDTVSFKNHIDFTSGKKFGFIAQELERIYPELVSTQTLSSRQDTNGNALAPDLTFKTVNYNGLIPIALSGIQEQQAQIDSLKNKIGTGLQGPKGDKGDKGDVGATGPQGPQGAPGTGALANNGVSLSTTQANTVVLGQNVNGGSGGIASFTSDRQIPLENFNLYFTSNGLNQIGKGRIGMGTTDPESRLDIRAPHSVSESSPLGLLVENNQLAQNGFATGAYFRVQAANSTNNGLRILSQNATSMNRGLLIAAVGPNTNEGIRLNAQDGNTNIGIAISALGKADNTSTNNSVGIDATASSGNENFGVRAISLGKRASDLSIRSTGVSGVGQGRASVENIGVFGDAKATTDGNAPTHIGVKGTATGGGVNWAGYFIGNLHATGTITEGSDSILKTNVNQIQSAHEIIAKLKPRSFYFDTVKYVKQMGLSSAKQYGFIAQDVQKVLPELVSMNKADAVLDTNGVEIAPEVNYLGLNYTAFISILTQGLQEQQATIDTLKGQVASLDKAAFDSLAQVVAAQKAVNATQATEIADLKERLDKLENCLGALLPTLCSLNQSIIEKNDALTPAQVQSKLSVVLNNANTIVLDQNVPNPFSEQTVINYTIPSTVKNAEIIFYNNSGVVINKVTLSERGAGALTVFGQDLSSGTYSYTLIADGAVVASKKMIKI